MKKSLSRIYSRHRPRLHRVARRTAYVLWYGAMVVVALWALAYAAARLLLPAVNEKKAQIEAFLERQSGYTVRIGQLDGIWDGLHPGLSLHDVRVYAAGGRQTPVRLTELRISLQVLPLLIGRAQIHSAVLKHPTLALERLVDGRFRISGFDAVEQPDSGQSESFTEWLFVQGRLVVEDGELQWLDRRESAQPLRLTQVQLQLRNSGDNHRLGLTAQFPPGICADCSLVADIAGNPFLGKSFNGEIYLRGREVDVDRMPRAIREQLPDSLRGAFSVELWSEWKDSRPQLVEGEVMVSHLRLPLAGLRAPLAVKQAAARLRWREEAGGFRLALGDLKLALHGAPWSAGNLEFVREQNQISLRVQRIDLADVSAFVAGLRLVKSDAKPLAESDSGIEYGESAALWAALNPTGVVRNLNAWVTGDFDVPRDLSLSADLDALAVEAYGAWPGVRGVGGRLSIERDKGELKLDLRDGALAMPRLFRAPLPLARVSADLLWERQTDQWLVTADDILVANEDLQARARLHLRLPRDPRQSPYLALNADFHDGNGAHAARYFPVHLLAPATLAWMERSFAGGTVTQGTLVFDGVTADFPFATGGGKFELHAQVRDAVYHFLPGWAPVTAASAEVTVDGAKFVVTGQGRIGALKANEVVVTGGGSAVVQAKVNVTGALAENLRVLREVKETPVPAWKEWLPPELEANGEGLLSLALAIPIDGRSFGMQGEYRISNGDLQFGGSAAAATAAAGSFRFDETGVRAGEVQAQFLGGASTLAISSPRKDEILAQLQGHITAAGLVPVLGQKIGRQLTGTAPWQARLRLIKGRRDIYAEADVSSLKTALPAPFNRPAGLSAAKLMVRTEATGRDSLTLGLGLGEMFQGRVRYVRNGGWRLSAGRLVFSESGGRPPAELSLPADGGLQLLLRLDDLNLDRWLAYVDGERGAGGSSRIARLRADMRSLTLFDRDFGRVSLDLAGDAAGWSGMIEGPAAAGRLRFASVPATRFELDLARLRVPPRRPRDQAGATAAASTTDPRKLPHVSIKTKTLLVQDREFGQLEFVAHPFGQGWKVEKIILTRPEARFEAQGSWRLDNGQASSQLAARFNSDDFGKTLAALGLPDQLEGGSVKLDAQFSWIGAPADMKYANVNGTLDAVAKKGRFLQLKQGAAKMFGVLDLTAIGRYLTLDFTPIFGKGFAFDRVEGKIAIERGSARTGNLTIRGPSAKIRANGRVGLVTEDFDLVVDVYPSLSGSLTLGGLLAGGPPAILWSLLIQKLFKKQIEEGSRVTYLIKGSWDNPTITRKLVEAEKSATPPDAGPSVGP